YDEDSGPATTFSPEAIKAELQRVERFVERAEQVVGDDGKFRALLKALQFVRDRKEGSGKLVVFTEFVVTQEYLRERLIESKLVSDEEITLFRGTNNTPRARAALERWRAETPQDEGTRPSREIAQRLALVHEFKKRSRVFISTEAGAKGLNLQFCDTVVNYDLPWNPQRIEQRIGRCHRYGQKNGVIVINFLARDNDAQRLTFDILSQKLELFGTVLSATDEVLHEAGGPGNGVLVSALGAEFEHELRRIYDRARSLEEVNQKLRELREQVEEQRKRFEDTHARTASLIEDRFDDEVRKAFRGRKQALPGALAELDRDLLSVVLAFLEARGIGHKREGDLLHVDASPQLGAALTAAIGHSTEHRSLHLSHPLVLAAIGDARAIERSPAARVAMPALHGKRGRLRLCKLTFDGFEKVEELVPVVVLEDGQCLPLAAAQKLLDGTMEDVAGARPSAAVTDEQLQEALDELLFDMQAQLEAAEEQRFERALLQAERYIEDRMLVLKSRRSRLQEQTKAAERQYEAATGAEARNEAQAKLAKLQTESDEVEGSMEKLAQRDDKRFVDFQRHIHERRYAPPLVAALFDVELEFA
ncbi:MAG TPA: helicase-related protein, partial [Polyangiales bacterium]|nr:helicase-related protein [Polyangiales bacterium]